jgi:hypothetical protein
MKPQADLGQGCSRRNFCASIFTSLLLVPFSKPVYSFVAVAVDERPKLFSRSGDADFDRALIAELKRICDILEVNPGFKYLDEMNAFATLETIWPGTNGTVMLGLPLMRKLMEDAEGGHGVAGVCAHECAHIYQYQSGFVKKLKEPSGQSVILSSFMQILLLVTIWGEEKSSLQMGSKKFRLYSLALVTIYIQMFSITELPHSVPLP